MKEIEKKVFEFATADLLGVFESGSEEWKNARKVGLGGSDAGTAIRCNKYSSWGKLFLEKTNVEIRGCSLRILFPSTTF
jgi:hypothetical protein